MAEELQEKESGINFNYYLDVARRRHMLFLVPLLLGWVAVWGASWMLPSRYRSSTLILVEQPVMSSVSTPCRSKWPTSGVPAKALACSLGSTISVGSGRTRSSISTARRSQARNFGE